jgi:hypothetical protein
MTITATELKTLVEAHQAGAAAAAEMLKPGNVFEGAFQIADRLFARTQAEWDFAVKGAYIEIQHYSNGILHTDAEGRIV